MHSYSVARNSHLTVLAQTSWPRVWVGLTSRQEGECWNGLRGLHPLSYHLDFMVGLASRVPPSHLDAEVPHQVSKNGRGSGVIWNITVL
jgi:hypothetical protein